MDFTFNDIDAVYASTNGRVTARLYNEQKPGISADSFVAAKAAVKSRLDRIRTAQIEAAWEHAHEQ